MSFSVFDYKKDLANLFVSPHTRALLAHRAR